MFIDLNGFRPINALGANPGRKTPHPASLPCPATQRWRSSAILQVALSAMLHLRARGFPLLPINDLHGHETGDAVLVGVATRLTNMLGDSGIVGRLGGDEFAILLDAHGGGAAVAASACRIMAAISEPFVIYGRTLNVAASIGIALSPRDGTETSALLRCADTAMYRAKQVPGGHFEFFAPDMALACKKATPYAAASCVL